MLSIVAACLGVFAMLGVGERSDVLAHLAGLGFGLAAGALVGRTVKLPLPALARLSAGGLAAAITTGAWWLAMR